MHMNALVSDHYVDLSDLADVFFFYRYGGHRDLHSFPTRRSSDLGSLMDLQLGDEKHTRSATSTLDVIWVLDRKSTRLNSSHTVISYAVFCLKKKNQSVLPMDEPTECLAPVLVESLTAALIRVCAE